MLLRSSNANRPLFLATALALAVPSLSTYAADPDGCWDAYHEDGGSCLEFSAENRGSRAYLSFENRCSERITLTWCVADQCGEYALRSGQSSSKYVYGDGSKSKAWAVGSKKPSKDRVCQERLGRF